LTSRDGNERATSLTPELLFNSTMKTAGKVKLTLYLCLLPELRSLPELLIPGRLTVEQRAAGGLQPWLLIISRPCFLMRSPGGSCFQDPSGRHWENLLMRWIGESVSTLVPSAAVWRRHCSRALGCN
jgi:hypothetical protein